jgi:hypothetical protein
MIQPFCIFSDIKDVSHAFWRFKNNDFRIIIYFKNLSFFGDLKIMIFESLFILKIYL